MLDSVKTRIVRLVICGSKLSKPTDCRLRLSPFSGAILGVVLVLTTIGCKKSEPVKGPPPATEVATQQSNVAGPVPQPLPTPATQQTIAPPASGNVDDTLAQLTRELHRTMIGRKLSGSFEEFVAIRNLKVPPPPPGKKYAISKQWRVVLVDQ